MTLRFCLPRKPPILVYGRVRGEGREERTYTEKRRGLKEKRTMERRWMRRTGGDVWIRGRKNRKGRVYKRKQYQGKNRRTVKEKMPLPNRAAEDEVDGFREIELKGK